MGEVKYFFQAVDGELIPISLKAIKMSRMWSALFKSLPDCRQKIIRLQPSYDASELCKVVEFCEHHCDDEPVEDFICRGDWDTAFFRENVAFATKMFYAAGFFRIKLLAITAHVVRDGLLQREMETPEWKKKEDAEIPELEST